MTNEEYRSFLLGRAHTATLATVRADGRPHAAPVWFDLDGDEFIFTTGGSTVKGRNMSRDHRISLCIDEESPPFHFVVIEGTSALTAGDPIFCTGRRVSEAAMWAPIGPTSTAGATRPRGNYSYG